MDFGALDPRDTGKYDSKDDAQQKLASDIATLADLQDKLYAEARNGVLVVLQGMDTAGKDGVVKHVMSGLNPAGVDVYSFKQPSEEEQRHDYLWRASKVLPERGRIAIFNRSYYEDVIVTRVHPQLLGHGQRRAVEEGEGFWKRRFREIANFERYLVDNGVVVVKFFLHISKEEQRKRLLKRLDDPSKQWKFSMSDASERAYWDDYMRAYEDMLEHTSNDCAPWYAIPANHKWFARLTVAEIIVDRLQELHPQYPKTGAELQERLRKVKEAIEADASQERIPTTR